MYLLAEAATLLSPNASATIGSMAGCTVTEAVYQYAGEPPLDKPVSFTLGCRCGACRQHLPTAPASRILTSQFGSWEGIAVDPTDGTRRLCAPCAHAYRGVGYRHHPAIVTPSTLTVPSQDQLSRVLAAPIASDTAVIVPLSGKKLLLPQGRWGYLTTDTGTLAWTSRHRSQLDAALQLRALGAPESSLREPSPPFVLFTTHPPETHEHIRQLWRLLASVRASKALLPLFKVLSRKEKP